MEIIFMKQHRWLVASLYNACELAHTAYRATPKPKEGFCIDSTIREIHIYKQFSDCLVSHIILVYPERFDTFIFDSTYWS